MARKRTRKPKLSKLLDNSPDVIAVVDHEFEIIYANDTCCRWLDMGADDLLGTKLKYGLDDQSTLTTNATGICPEPSCFDSDFKTSQGHIRSNADGKMLWKAATFTAVRESKEFPPCVIITSYGNDLTSLENETPSLHNQIGEWIHLLRSQDKLHFAFDQLIGTSEYANQLRRKIKAVADNQSDCLIVGPPGSGREHIARTIFAKRDRPASNLVPIHCAIADSQVIQDSMKEWVFDQRKQNSNDWMLLLDVDKMQADAQLELYGYTQLPNFPMRIMATCEYDLMERAEEREFHAGLAMQLSIQIIRLLPLESRKSDLPSIAQFFIDSFNNTSKQQISGVSDDVLERFYEYHWPANLDEFKQCIHDAHRNCGRSIITEEDLPDSFRHALMAAGIGYNDTEKIELEQFLADIEGQLIARALKNSNQNKTKAAELLGINRAKLLRRANALQILQEPAAKTDNQVDSSAFKEADQ